MTKDLISFLLARIDEDEARAHAAPHGGWRVEEVQQAPHWSSFTVIAPPPPPGTVRVDQGGPDDDVFILDDERPEMSAFVAHFDPARALAECRAKRQIIERAGFVRGRGLDVIDVTRADMTIGTSRALRDVLQQLAAVYADHSDFRDEWLRGA